MDKQIWKVLRRAPSFKYVFEEICQEYGKLLEKYEDDVKGVNKFKKYTHKYDFCFPFCREFDLKVSNILIDLSQKTERDFKRVGFSRGRKGNNKRWEEKT